MGQGAWQVDLFGGAGPQDANEPHGARSDVAIVAAHRPGSLPQHLTASNEHYTPEWIASAARVTMGSIDLDPASCTQANQIIRAERFYTQADDGLTAPWFGRCFLNPPYGWTDHKPDWSPAKRNPLGYSQKELWTQRVIRDIAHHEIHQAVTVVTATSGDPWFEVFARCGRALCLPPRIQFWGPDGESSGQPGSSAIFYHCDPRHDHGDRFFEVFGCHGMTSDLRKWTFRPSIAIELQILQLTRK